MSAIIQEFEAIARRICQELLESAEHTLKSDAPSSSEEAQKVQQTLSLIKAKEFVTIKDAAFLLSCSDSHIRNLISKAKKGKTPYPIPYRDLDGVTTFRLAELLEWTEARKSKLKAVRRKEG